MNSTTRNPASIEPRIYAIVRHEHGWQIHHDGCTSCSHKKLSVVREIAIRMAKANIPATVIVHDSDGMPVQQLIFDTEETVTGFI